MNKVSFFLLLFFFCIQNSSPAFAQPTKVPSGATHRPSEQKEMKSQAELKKLMEAYSAIDQANSSPGNDQRVCATMQLDSIRQLTNKKNQSASSQMQEWSIQENTNSTLSVYPPTKAVAEEVLRIPVIVHIVHNGEEIGTGANISAAQVKSQLDVLNEDFRRVAGSPGYNNNPVGADVRIEFVPALVNPQGVLLPEPGIHRYNGYQTSWSIAQTEVNLKPATIWDPNLYFNIWTLNLRGNTLGYAQFPGNSGLKGLKLYEGSAETDGVAIGYKFFGARDKGDFPELHDKFGYGRTTTHEVGHFLGLLHIWGDGDCSRDDYCGDTPDASHANYGCPTGEDSCPTPGLDMVENYMDYTDDQCMNIFTLDQLARMETVLSVSPRRASLTRSTVGGYRLNIPLAAFSSNKQTILAGQQVIFSDESGASLDRKWVFEGGTPQSSVRRYPVVTYSKPGTYTVGLYVKNEVGADTLIRMEYIKVLSNTACNSGSQELAPSAAFSVSSTQVCKDETVVFNTSSANNIAGFKWYFDGGIPAISLESSPSVTYSKPGTYNVSLKVEGVCGGTDSIVKKGYINVLDKPDLVAYTAKSSMCLGDSMTVRASGADIITWYPAESLDADSGSQVAASPDQTTLYLVKGVNANGCESLMNVLVPVSPIPDVTISPSDPKICGNESKILRAKGAMEYTWLPAEGLSSVNGASVVAQPQQTTTYTVIGENPGGCTDTSYVTVEVGVPVTSEFTVSDTLVDLTFSGIVSFEDNSVGADAWVWDFGDGRFSTEQDPVINYTNSGTYVVYLTTKSNSSFCTGISKKVVEVINADRAEQLSKNDRINIYPNPAKDRVTIKTGNLTVKEIWLINSVGQKVRKYDFSATSSELDLSGLLPGFYVVSLFSDQGIINKKLIIEAN